MTDEDITTLVTSSIAALVAELEKLRASIDALTVKTDMNYCQNARLADLTQKRAGPPTTAIVP